MIPMQVADFYKHRDTTNKLRSHLVKTLIAKCHKILEEKVYNKEEFTTRVSYLLQSNDPQSRIISLRLFSYLPSFIQTRLDIQHKILHILTSTQNNQEREVANQTITMISEGSELFAQSIMNKVEETVLSGNFSRDTCSHFIMAISNISGDAQNAIKFVEIIKTLYEKAYHIYGGGLDSVLLLSLIKMVNRSPIILNKASLFLKDIQNLEGLELISRKYIISDDIINKLLNQIIASQSDVSKEQIFLLKIIVNNSGHLKDLKAYHQQIDIILQNCSIENKSQQDFFGGY
ncbi:UNKNOWN [Stylonychia lemnae]|uniref:Integrator complex subunit 7 N-terminal domain-containing protein n=1 Tax=Stylonychia lemnae TaxID=5949 RepID=A0A078AHN2_STYLE|nr:UNKNOWN [Stylonychia lemnae]|eukprot:CDW81759.1 UNKNOWN [Stylonychia lemnae]